MEKESVFLCCVLVATTIDKAILLSEVGFERQGGFALVINVFYSLAHYANERLAHLHTANVHSYAMSLHHGSFAVAVDYETRQIVALAMHQTIGVVVGIVGNAKAAANLKSRSKTSCPEVVVDFNISERQHSYGDRTNLEMAYGEEVATCRQHSHNIALSNIVVTTENSSREYPRMKTL